MCVIKQVVHTCTAVRWCISVDALARWHATYCPFHIMHADNAHVRYASKISHNNYPYSVFMCFAHRIRKQSAVISLTHCLPPVTAANCFCNFVLTTFFYLETADKSECKTGFLRAHARA